MKRHIGTRVSGIRLPIINQGDPLPKMVADAIAETVAAEGWTLRTDDVIAVKEAIVARSQGNYATLAQLGEDIRAKFPGGEVGVVFPIFSRNRFVNILKGIQAGAEKVIVLLKFPFDEVGNPIMDGNDFETLDRLRELPKGPISAAQFREITGPYRHPYTGEDYIKLYQSLGAEVYLSEDPCDILRLTPHVLAADIHSRFHTHNRLVKAGAATAYTLSDLLCTSVSGSGWSEYGVLGSNIATGDKLKLFPRDGGEFVAAVQDCVAQRLGVRPEVMIYGDGAFKDPVYGIWELADPVVSPAFTPRLGGQPVEVKMKMVADTLLSGMQEADQVEAMKTLIRQKELMVSGEPAQLLGNQASAAAPLAAQADSGLAPAQQSGPLQAVKAGRLHESVVAGTTPRIYADLLGSLCDLTTGSGDKGTPIVLVQGYFDNYAND